MISITCKCGQENAPNRIFCARCGAKLELERYARRQKAGLGASGFMGFFKLALTLALLGAIGLLLWPVEPMGTSGSEADARMVSTKLRDLHRASQNGIYLAHIFSEAEINAFMEQTLKQQNKDIAESKGLQLGIRTINVELERDAFTVVVRAVLGPIPLSYEIHGAPIVGRNAFGVKPIRIRWGHLPLPLQASDWMLGRLGSLFAEMKGEKRVLDSLSRLDLAEDRSRLIVGEAR